ncbi:hypothetical protein ACLB2K_055200 [Fragaria x ananassa]
MAHRRRRLQIYGVGFRICVVDYRSADEEAEAVGRGEEVAVAVGGARRRSWQWIKMVTRNYVRVLRLLIDFAFDVGVLVELELMHCSLDGKAFIEEHTVFVRLKTLILSHVYFNEVAVGELMIKCPLLETLEIYFCGNIKHVELCDFPNLKKVELWNGNSFTYKIDSPYLESLLYFEDGKPMDIEEVSCNNLRKLDVIAHGSTITDQYIKEVYSKFSFLEDLLFNAQSFGSKDVDEIRIFGNHLKSLLVCGHICQTMIINLDAPNLVDYQREGYDIPPTFLVNCRKLERVTFRVCGGTHLNSAWFLKLRDYLGKFAACDRLRFRIYHRIKRIVEFSFEELQELKLPPVARVRELVLRVVPSLRDYTAFVDDILWSCRPLTISVQLQAYDSPNRKFIKFLYRMLMDREEYALCCRECRIKCWRHYLFSARITKSSCDSEDGRADDDDVEEEDKFLYRMLMDREEDALCCRECRIKCWRHCLFSARITKSSCDSEDGRADDDDVEEEDKVEDREEDEEKDENEEEGEVVQVQVGDGEGVGVGVGEGEGVEEGVDGDGDNDGDDDDDDDDDDDAELFKTLRRLEKNYVFELQWSTWEDHGELVGLELGFSRD